MPAAFPDRIAHAWPSAPEVGAINLDAADFEAAPEACTFALITDRAGFDALETDWNDLFWRAGRRCQIFQTFNWNWHWSNHYLPAPSDEAAPSLAIVTGRRGGASSWCGRSPPSALRGFRSSRGWAIRSASTATFS